MTQATHATPTSPTTTLHRFEIRQLPAVGDPLATTILHTAQRLHINPERVDTARVYIIEADLTPEQTDTATQKLLADPAKESATLGIHPPEPNTLTLEIHPLPGVMDPAANTVSQALAEILNIDPPRVSTGHRYDFQGITPDQRDTIARELANPVVDDIHTEPWLPDHFPSAHPADQTLKHITITTLTDPELETLSREGHLFLSLEEMQAIQSHYRNLKREPTDIELETLAQTWSEHCVHKTLKSTVTYKNLDADGNTIPITKKGGGGDIIDWANVPNSTINPDGSVTIQNLLKSTVADATFTLIDPKNKANGTGTQLDCLSVFVDNAGIFRFDEHNAIAVKVETHNHPSAIEPYGGAATGIGGVIRDIIGTGLAAKPIANTNYFCVAHPHDDNLGLDPLPPGVLPPRKVLTRVIDGVRDYGNRMGIPTINAAVTFDNDFVGNPLVFAGSIGLLPPHLAGSHDPKDQTGKAEPGDLIVALGGRTGRDGIHGATFSSAELTDTHADEFSHAVQIGNPIEEKKFLDAILRTRDHESGVLFSAITDCGAGGFSSAIGEMGEHVGATVHLDQAPLKYAGLRYDEIWISESQERMILAVPKDNLDQLQAICDEEQTELAVLGTFGPPPPEFATERTDTPTLLLLFNNKEVGRMPMPFLHDGIPMPTRQATWTPTQTPPPVHLGEVAAKPTEGAPGGGPGGGAGGGVSEARRAAEDPAQQLLNHLAHPNNASKQFIARQYDHEVQGNTVIRPFVGPNSIGPSPAAVIQPDPNSKQGLAIACGLTASKSGDPYINAINAVDQCVRNLVCVGADPDRIAILDNFCWPSCNQPKNMGSLVRAAAGCREAALQFRAPFISGKDSLNNQFTYTDPKTNQPITIEIPPTLLITGVAIIDNIDNAITMDLKPVPGSRVLLLNTTNEEIWHHRIGGVDMAQLTNKFIQTGKVLAAHAATQTDFGSKLTEMLLAAPDSTGLDFGPSYPELDITDSLVSKWYPDTTGTYILQVDESLITEDADNDWIDLANSTFVRTLIDGTEIFNFWISYLGKVTETGKLTLNDSDSLPTTQLRNAFTNTFKDW